MRKKDHPRYAQSQSELEELAKKADKKRRSVLTNILCDLSDGDATILDAHQQIMKLFTGEI